MQITDLYQTKITCSTYNANIDSTDTVITVKLIDFNGAAVTNKSVTLTCDKGYFNKNGSTTISGTSTKSITATTDSSGEITATWTASEWGLCTFSTNNTNIQVRITGWKTKYTETNYTVEYNERYGLLRVHGTLSSTSGHQQFSPNSVITGDLRPTTIASGISYDGQIVFYIREYDGMIMHRTVHNNTLSNQAVYATIFWKHNLLTKPV